MAVQAGLHAQLFSESMALPLPLPTMCGSQDWLVDSVLGIDDHGVCSQEQPQFIHQLIGPSNTNSNQEAYSFSTSGPAVSSLSMALASELEKQKLEMDWFLQVENQRLRTVVQEETRQQAVLLQSYESRITSLVRQKDEDLAMARNKAMKLQDFVAKAEVEAKVWQKKALEYEAMVLDLNNKLNQAIEGGFLLTNGVQDAESCCDSSGRGRNNAQQAKQGKSTKKTLAACKLCKATRMCIVFLPCRHLCCCKTCETLLGLCPICNSVKKSSVEVFLV